MKILSRKELREKKRIKGLWSRSRDLLVWRSPQFLRSDVVRVGPAQNAKTAAVSGAILHHLREIMKPEAPLTKLEAQRRAARRSLQFTGRTARHQASGQSFDEHALRQNHTEAGVSHG